MKKRQTKYLLPIWAYAIMNLVFLGFVVGVYYWGRHIAQEQFYSLTGIVPVLFVCYVAFTVACIYDAAYDRLSLSRMKGKKSNTVASSSLSSRDGSRKLD